MNNTAGSYIYWYNNMDSSMQACTSQSLNMTELYDRMFRNAHRKYIV